VSFAYLARGASSDRRRDGICRYHVSPIIPCFINGMRGHINTRPGTRRPPYGNGPAQRAPVPSGLANGMKVLAALKP